MNDLRAVLFPHTWISRDNIERIALLFGPFGICLPWQLQAIPGSSEDTDGNFPARILRPPPELKPDKDIASMLSGYYDWAGSTRIGSYASSLKASESMATSEDHTWNIRKSILGDVNSESETLQDRALKWHLMLHLAHKLDETRWDVREMLKKVKMGKQPLEGALEQTSSSRGLFGDIPSPGGQSPAEQYKPEPVVEAWMGLFGEHLENFHTFITLDRIMMDYLISSHEDVVSGQLDSENLPEIAFDLPDIMRADAEGVRQGEVKYPSDESPSGSLKMILSALGTQDGRQNDEIPSLFKKLQQGSLPAPGDRKIHVELTRLPRPPTNREIPVNRLGGKTIILMSVMG